MTRVLVIVDGDVSAAMPSVDGWSIRSVRGIDAGLWAGRLLRPDCVIWMCPAGNFSPAILALREHARQAGVAILVADPDLRESVSALEHGATLYLQQPEEVTRAELERIIEMTCAVERQRVSRVSRHVPSAE
jgi:DNA-binding response OmpR family regulator